MTRALTLFLPLSLAVPAVLALSPAQAETGRRCDTDQDRLSGSSFVIAPDGRFCEMSAYEERAFVAQLDAAQAQAEAEAEALRKAAHARAMAELRRNAELSGYTPAQAAKMAEQAAADAKKAAENASQLAQARSGAPRPSAPAGAPKPAGGCIGGAQAGGPCLPMPAMKNTGAALARTMQP